MINLLITHFYNDYHGSFPGSLNRFVLENKNDVYVLVNNWINHKMDGSIFKTFAAEIENELDFKNILKNLDLKDYSEGSTFDVIDRGTILHIVNGLLESINDYGKYRAYITARQNLTWYENYSDIYLAIDSAINLLELKELYCNGFKSKNINEMYEKYCSEYYNFDFNYRKFYFYYDKTKLIDIILFKFRF